MSKLNSGVTKWAGVEAGDKDLAFRIESFVGYDTAKYIDALKRKIIG